MWKSLGCKAAVSDGRGISKRLYGLLWATQAGPEASRTFSPKAGCRSRPWDWKVLPSALACITSVLPLAAAAAVS
jgi:hypothetical protein